MKTDIEHIYVYNRKFLYFFCLSDEFYNVAFIDLQAAIPQIIENTKEDFFLKIVEILRGAADICFDRLNEIPCITCPSKPEGSMFVMVIDQAHQFIYVFVSEPYMQICN